MNNVEILSLILSVIVLFVAAFTAFINYLNYKAITSFSLYVRTDTKSQKVTEGSLANFPNRITKTLTLNDLIPIEKGEILIIRWFDLILGNTGPGLVRNIKWEVDYSIELETQDKDDMCSQEPFDLGPQSNLVIVGYLPRDYALINEEKQNYKQFNKLPIPDNKSTWILNVSYEIPQGIGKNLKRNEKYAILPNGIASRINDDTAGNKNGRRRK